MRFCLVKPKKFRWITQVCVTQLLGAQLKFLGLTLWCRLGSYAQRSSVFDKKWSQCGALKWRAGDECVVLGIAAQPTFYSTHREC
ncbi:MAG: hypothetical protein RL497_195 [Pseudomonadota bacterium]|jgi:hypothetical protein